MPKKITLNDLAKMMKKGFDETSRNFGIASELIASNFKHIQSLTGVLKLTRQEMAKDEDMRATKNTINAIYQMLDRESRSIQQIQTEYPLILKRLERIKKQLDLPHTIS